MAEEAFDSLDEAAVAGAHGLGWAPLLSPIDVLSFGAMDVLLKPTMNLPPVSLAPVTARTPPTVQVASAPTPVPLAPAPVRTSPPRPSLPIVSSGVAKKEARPVKRRVTPRKRSGTLDAHSSAAAGPRRLSRSEEALEYGELADIGGTTAARSRQMSEEERRVMLYKRKLRNRASAARSREKRCRTILELSKEVHSLLEVSTKLRVECNSRAAENNQIMNENKKLKAENSRLREVLAHSSVSSASEL